MAGRSGLTSSSKPALALTVAVVMDTAASMEGALGYRPGGRGELVRRLGPDDQAAIFGRSVSWREVS